MKKNDVLDILIFSKEKSPDVQKVVEWLDYFDTTYHIITPKSNLRIVNFQLLTDGEALFEIDVNNKTINICRIKSCWIESGVVKNDFIKNIKIEDAVDKTIVKFLLSEWNILIDYLFYKIEKQNCLGSRFYGFPNKLIQLELATNLGLMVPGSLVFSEQLRIQGLQYRDFITKPIQEVFNMVNKNEYYRSYTGRVNEKDLELNKGCFPFLLQEYINKRFELRIFYLQGKIYACAIFSQQDEKTKLDFRINSESLRMVPFQLPYFIEIKLKNLMHELKLVTGSIDMIYSNAGEYVFLEVNPVGIFDNISYLTNGFFHKKIANYLAYES